MQQPKEQKRSGVPIAGDFEERWRGVSDDTPRFMKALLLKSTILLFSIFSPIVKNTM